MSARSAQRPESEDVYASPIHMSVDSMDRSNPWTRRWDYGAVSSLEPDMDDYCAIPV